MRCPALASHADARTGQLRTALLLPRERDTERPALRVIALKAGRSGLPDGFEGGVTRLARGARLRRSRQRVRAREELRAALEVFEGLGARPWADQALAELTASGETARRRDASTLDDLTPQELQIARLLTEGRTTREAAAALFLSPKTIEYHLRNVYRKLDVHSRDELAARLGEPVERAS